MPGWYVNRRPSVTSTLRYSKAFCVPQHRTATPPFSKTTLAKPRYVLTTFASRGGLLPSVRALLDFLVRECAAQRTAADRSLGRGDLAMGDA